MHDTVPAVHDCTVVTVFTTLARGQRRQIVLSRLNRPAHHTTTAVCTRLGPQPCQPFCVANPMPRMCPARTLSRYARQLTAYDGNRHHACSLPGVMLAARHVAERLQNCWHGGARSTGQLRDAMSAALAEYVTSGDSAEAARCLAELDVPHFHHELVKCVYGCTCPLLGSDVHIYYARRQCLRHVHCSETAQCLPGSDVCVGVVAKASANTLWRPRTIKSKASA